MKYDTQTVQDLLAVFFLAWGIFFMFVGSVGIFRMPDVYHRIHSASKCSTLGVMGLLLAVAFHVGTVAIIAKAVMVLVFAFVALPVGSHMLGKAAVRSRAHQWRHTLYDQYAEDHPEAEAPKGE